MGRKMNGASQGTIIRVNVAGVKNVFIMSNWCNKSEGQNRKMPRKKSSGAFYIALLNFWRLTTGGRGKS
jgi:hypothetical protein